MDVLADILSAIDLQASLYFRAGLGSPFAIAVPEDRQRIRFHLAGRGRAWIGLPCGEGAYFTDGDLVLVPHGSAHILANDPDSPALPLQDVLAQADASRVGYLRYGGNGPAVELVCGHFGFNESLVQPIATTLPPLIRIARKHGEGFGWLRPLLATMQEESRDGMPGYEQVLVRLSEVIFIQVLRTYMRHQPDSSVALTALVDPHLGPTLEAVHNAPGFDWSLERLAEVAGLSRTVFAERFKLKLAMTPMRYVTAWRMQKARALMRNYALSIGDIGKAVGYASDAAFSRIFKEHYGLSPGVHRKSKESE